MDIEAWQRVEAILGRMPAEFPVIGEAIEPFDLPLAFQARGMIGWQAADQGANPLAELQCEVRRRGAHQLTHILDGDLAPVAKSIWILGLAHFWGTASSRVSISACAESEIACWLPITQPWL
jgi:hypothetical protein